MLITCHSCETSYEVEPSSLGPTGRSVRCVRCGHVWFAANTSALSAIAESHRAEMAAFSTAEVDGMPAPGATDTPAGDAPATGIETETDLTTQSPARDVAPTEPVMVDDAPALAPDFGGDLAGDLAGDLSGDLAGDPAADAAAELASSATVSAEPSPAAAAAPLPEDIESVAARRRAKARVRRKSLWAMPGIGTAILALLALNTGLIAWRTDVVRLLPQTASLYAAIGLPVNLRGLTFNGLTTTAETQDGVQVLVVEGTITNTTKRTIEVPRLRFSVRNDKGSEVYTWTALPTKSVLAPGETLPFQSRLASPPRDTHQVLVRFFNRRDLVAGVQ